MNNEQQRIKRKQQALCKTEEQSRSLCQQGKIIGWWWALFKIEEEGKSLLISRISRVGGVVVSVSV
jgi:hypothetical protein